MMIRMKTQFIGNAFTMSQNSIPSIHVDLDVYGRETANNKANRVKKKNLIYTGSVI